MPFFLPAHERLDGNHAGRRGRWLVRVAVPSAKPRHRGLDAPSASVSGGRLAKTSSMIGWSPAASPAGRASVASLADGARVRPMGGARPLRPRPGRGGTGEQIRPRSAHRQASGPRPVVRPPPAAPPPPTSPGRREELPPRPGVVRATRTPPRDRWRTRCWPASVPSDLLSHRRGHLLTSDPFQASLVLRVIGGFVDGEPPCLGAVMFEDEGGERRRTRADQRPRW